MVGKASIHYKKRIGFKMKKKNSKSKGSSFERTVAKQLSLWVSNGKRDDHFWRTAGSGSRSTIRSKKGKLTEGGSGDICSMSMETKIFTDALIFECKHLKNLNLWSFITHTMSDTYYGYWKELTEKAKQEEKIPVLIAKENNKPTLFITNSDLSDKITFFFSTDIELKAEFGSGDDKICIYYLDDILSLSPDCFISLLKDTCTILFEKGN